MRFNWVLFGHREIMAITVDQIVEETRQWPDDVVAELIERITLAKYGPVDPKVEDAWGETALRRLAELESGKAKLIPGDEVSKRIGKLGGR